MHLNIQGGVLHKLHDLELLLENSSISILCINEHWLKNDQIGVLNSLPNYNLCSYYCRDEDKHGGSCIIMKNNLKFKVREDICKMSETFIFEACCVEILDFGIVVVSIYRTPYSANLNAFFNRFELLLNNLSKTNVNKVYIAGDFNIDTLEGCSFSKHKVEFLSLISMYNFQVHFFLPTRVTGTAKSCIDNIFSLKTGPESERLTMNLELGLSDHRALFISILESDKVNSKYVSNKCKRRIFSDNGKSMFLCRVKNTEWETTYENNFIDNCSKFFNTFHLAFEESFPLKFYRDKTSVSQKCKKSWVTKGIRISSLNKRKLSIRAKECNDLDFLNYVKMYKKVFKSVCLKSKQMYNSGFIKKAENKSKAAWCVVKSNLGINSVNRGYDFADILVEGKTINSVKDIAEYFNKRYTEISKLVGVSPQMHEALKMAQKTAVTKHMFSFQTVNAVDVFKAIVSLKNKKTAGWDEIPVDLLKTVSCFIADPLSVLINQSFENGNFPDHLKHAELKPLLKKGDKHNPVNYRPVSILPSFSKIFEKLAFEQIWKFLEENHILANEQFGFRRGKSTISAISNLLEELLWSLDGSQKTIGVFCDLSKAFDCVDHSILLKKLSMYNFSKAALSWIKSYLTNRYQRTVISKSNSKTKSVWRNIQVGVPQGSILGPLLFLLYINDLPKNVSHSLVLYADDTTAVIKAKCNDELNSKLSEAINELTHWFNVNGLSLNQEKTQLVQFSTVHSKNILQEGFNLEYDLLSLSDSTKFLGVELDSSLKWDKCIEKILKKLNTATFQMLRLRETVDLQTRLMVYYAYFYSILQYGIEFWGCASKIDLIFKCQKKFLRIMTLSSWRASCKPIFKDLQILTVPCLYILKTLLLLKSNFWSICGDQNVHKYETRFKTNLQYPIHRLKLTEKSPQYMSKRFFNKLPTSLQNLIHSDSFQGSITDLLLDKNYYSVNEFLNDKLVL